MPTLRATARVTATQADDDELELVAATRHRYRIETGTDVNHVGIDVETTIPRSVGLAGSSAIVIATIRALDAWTGTGLSNDDVAAMCHTVERSDLNIAGGWQDQISQSHMTRDPLLMEFGQPLQHRSVPAKDVPLFLAWSRTAAEPSQVVHSDLQSRADEVDAVMTELAGWARFGADALTAGSTHDLKTAMNASFDLRETVQPIRREHKAMITAARDAGAACNFAGSGGAIIGVVPKDPEAFADAMAAAGLEVLSWILGS